MRSVVVVLPASMWAMMPMFLQRSNGTVLGTTLSTLSGARNPLSAFDRQRFSSNSPPVMRERLIRFRHPVNVFLLLDRCAFSGRGVQQLVAQLVDHAFFTASTRIRNQPADRERRTAVRIHFDRHLVVRAAHTTALYFEQRLGILHGLGE